MKRLLLMLLISSCSTVSLIGQVFHNNPYFVGYKNESITFFDPTSWSLFLLKEDELHEISRYSAETFVTYVSDLTEVLYSFMKREYTIIIEKDTFKVANLYQSIAVDDNEMILYATLPKNHEEHPLEIKKVNLKDGSVEYTGTKGYVHKVVGNHLFFYIETDPLYADTPYDIYRVNVKELNKPERIFENQNLNLDFEISSDGQMFFARNLKERVIQNIQTGMKQIIKDVPIYNYAELPPVFSFDGLFLVFYQTKPFEIKKIGIDINAAN